MQNDAGEFVDLYVPRKCSASNRIIGAKDHASIQMNVAEVDKVTGRFNGQFKTYAICGAIRRMGESDDSILRLAKADGIVSNELENWTTEFVQRTTNLEKQSPGLYRSEDHRQLGSECDNALASWPGRALGEAVLWAVK
ncbi:hypothetical protein QTO34_001723 [Cnephaeus nilssonii]|uniref:Small ribosomal subunit protein eS21 n=1 Tax=Cnephaeus nilssonii TaxID=3371016 RepID=A0AA40HUB9_CNENI|nr:hypothetical protein QTO34_001723 [Eptesicus nilssonii]